MIQETSKLAFEEIKEKMGERQLEVYEAIEELGEPTDYEIARLLFKLDPNYVRPRRYELVNKLKMVGFAGKRKCTVTNKMAMTWRILR